MPKIIKILFQRKYLHSHAMSRTGKPIQMKDTPDLMTHSSSTLSMEQSGLGQVTAACPYLLSQGGGLGMAGGDCCVIPEQQVVHGSPHDLTAADHHGSLPCHLDTCTTQSHRQQKRGHCAAWYTLTQAALESWSVWLWFGYLRILFSFVACGRELQLGGRKERPFYPSSFTI